MNYFTGHPQRVDKVAIRVFFIDEEGGKPISGLVVSIVAEPPRDMDTAREEQAPSLPSGRLLASLQTDYQAGFASFKFDPSILAGIAQLTVTYGASRRNALTLNVANLLAGNDTFTIRVDASALGPSDLSPGLPAVMSPDSRDAALSPGSIGLTPQLQSDGLCSQLMPTTLGVRRFQAFHIILRESDEFCVPETLVCSDEVQIVTAKILEYEISWFPVGTCLGDLLNTITLAPCEQVNVAVVDWMRRETAVLTQASELQEQRTEQTNHDRLINEAMQSSVKSKSRAWSVGSRNTITIPIEEIKLDMTAAWGVAGGKSTQTVAANTSNQLSERISQTSSLVASRSSSSVFQTTASEHQTYQTRTIRNHNHCHTLTMMYYQVNCSYDVVTDYQGERDVILVKYENKDFDARRAYCNAEVLKDALLDPSLIGCFDELADALFCCDQKPGEMTENEMLIDSLLITVQPKEVQAFGDVMAIDLHSATAINDNPLVFGEWIHARWAAGGVFKHTVNLRTPIDAAQVASMKIRLSASLNLDAPQPIAILNELEVLVRGPGHDDLILYSSKTETTIKGSWRTPAKAKLPEPPPHAGVENKCVAASCGIQKLLGHLNSHKRYYNSIVWLNEDPNERVMKWSCCTRMLDRPFSLIDLIENTPITVYGDFVVFPMARGELLDDPSVLPVSKLVTMPTPGVYAEGILGQCDTCEVIDPNRHWNWKDSPCPDSAPAVVNPPAPKTGATVSDLKADALTSLISFSNVPDAPASGIRDLITTLLANADKGSAEAKDMLAKLLETIKASIPTAAPKT